MEYVEGAGIIEVNKDWHNIHRVLRDDFDVASCPIVNNPERDMDLGDGYYLGSFGVTFGSPAELPRQLSEKFGEEWYIYFADGCIVEVADDKTVRCSGNPNAVSVALFPKQAYEDYQVWYSEISREREIQLGEIRLARAQRNQAEAKRNGKLLVRLWHKIFGS